MLQTLSCWGIPHVASDTVWSSFERAHKSQIKSKLVFILLLSFFKVATFCLDSNSVHCAHSLKPHHKVHFKPYWGTSHIYLSIYPAFPEQGKGLLIVKHWCVEEGNSLNALKISCDWLRFCKSALLHLRILLAGLWSLDKAVGTSPWLFTLLQ